MKNIHILPTDKPSELYINMQGVLSKSNSLLLRLKSRNIFITNDEEIKDGDWYYSYKANSIYKKINNESTFYPNFNSICKKIILTTDQDLIKDGVQAIPDEFLEWFIKNPNCEEVDVEQVSIMENRFVLGYKIIIPKEESKKETLEKREWLPIFNEYVKDNECNLYAFFNWLETNYNPPTKK